MTEFDEMEELDTMDARDVDGIPYCPRHHCRMENASGGKKGSRTTYYACKVPGCDEKSQTVKSRLPGVVPSNPQLCPRCNKKGSKPVYCERDKTVSTAMAVVLKCPACQWKSTAIATPQFAASHLASRQIRREPVANVGDR